MGLKDKLEISIIIAMYNMEKYIEECLDSIFNDKYKNIEVIVVDDGSVDNSCKLVERYEAKYSNLIFLKQKNNGQAAARNKALGYATGEYITYMDADDYFEQDSLQRVYETIQKLEPDILIAEYKKVFNDEIKGINQVYRVPVDIKKTYKGHEVAEMMLKEQVQGFSWAKFFKKELLLKTEFHQEEGRYIEDLFPVFKAVVNADKIVFLGGFVYNYRQRASSSVNERSLRLMDDYIHAANQVINYARQDKKINQKSIETFAVISYLSVINYYTQANIEMKRKIYKNFKTLNNMEKTPSLFKVFINKNLTSKRKLSLLIWKLGLYHLVMERRMNRKYN